jgi:polysaccharide export outer membrane protein
MKHLAIRMISVVAISGGLCAPATARQAALPEGAAAGYGAPLTPATLPADYVIGAEDVLSIVFWREKEMSADVVVRPDGKISLPLLKDVHAAGYTPEQLTVALVKAASKYIGQPNATVIVKEINSRNVSIIGQVAEPGAFPLTRDMTVLELIALAGDVLEYAKSKGVVIVRKEGENERRFKFNYKEVVKGKNTKQNILLKPGDTVIVP